MKRPHKILHSPFSILHFFMRLVLLPGSVFGILEPTRAGEFYYTNFNIAAISFNVPYNFSADMLEAESARLTNIVVGAGIVVNSNETSVIESEGVALGYLDADYTAADTWVRARGSLQPVRTYPGEVRQNVGWVRGTKRVEGEWSAFLWTAQNRIVFKASATNAWHGPQSDVTVPISKVIVGSLGIYDPLEDVNDLGPDLSKALNTVPGAGDEGDYLVDISNDFYAVRFPYVWVWPQRAFACAGGSNVGFVAQGNDIPGGVDWSLYPTNFEGHAELAASGNQATITPGNIATNYKVRATSKDNTNFYDEADLYVIKVDIVQSNEYAGVGGTNNVSLYLTADSSAKVAWTITPDLGTNGAGFANGPMGAGTANTWMGTNVWLAPGNGATSYTIKAYATSLTNCYDTCTVTVFKVEIAMDGNRDGEIIFGDTNDNHYLFWVNDDHDERYQLQTESFIWVEDDLGGAPDWDNEYIGFKSGLGSSCRRDLEDFTRLHIVMDDRLVNMPGITYFLKLENVSGSPSVNIFQAINAGMGYLQDGVIADQQIQETRLLTVGTSEVPLPSQYIKATNQVSPFILEGASAGKGDLTVIVKKGGKEIGRTAVMLELRTIDKFYQFFRVASVGQSSEEIPSSTNYNSDFTSSDDYLLYVHGFNVNAIDKAYYPGAIFKRLWWQGYKGHFGWFDWPCVLFDLSNPKCYDDSEYNAWRCGAALLDRINQLNSGGHSGKVRLLAHSQGNVVAGEALRLASGQVVRTYIATQAAIPAGCYQTGIASYIDTTNTPDVFVNYPPTSAPYLVGVANKADQRFSYHNYHDYALYDRDSIGSWEWNNARRPDLFYHYEGPLDSYDTSAEPPSRFYYDVLPLIPPDPRDMVFTNDTFEIFSYAAQAHGSTLGVQTSMVDFVTFDLRAPPLNYDDEHYSHSRQFRSNIVDEKRYWEKVMESCGFISSYKR